MKSTNNEVDDQVLKVDYLSLMDEIKTSMEMEQLSEKKYDDFVRALTEMLNRISLLPNNPPNSQTLERQSNILEALANLDKKYVNETLCAEGNSVKTVIFTRHGYSSDSKKKLGFNPNAAVGKKALQAMVDITDRITSGLIGGKEEEKNTTINISPMVRALQTASTIVPNNFKGDIKISSHITEKSNAPSGKDIRDRTMLNGGFVGWISNRIFGGRIGDIILPQRKRAITILKSKKISGGEIEDPAAETGLDDDTKISHIQASINSTKPGKTQWNICHGKISRKFFQDTLGYDTKFTFGESKKILYYQGKDGADKAYIPSYSIVINQTTGLLEARPAQKHVCDVKPFEQLIAKNIQPGSHK